MSHFKPSGEGGVSGWGPKAPKTNSMGGDGGGTIIPTPHLQLYNAGICPARFMMVCLVMCCDVHGGKVVELEKRGGIGGKWGETGQNGEKWGEMGGNGGATSPSVRAWCG